MKRVGVALIVLAMIASMVGCGGGADVSEVQAQEAFAVAFGSFFNAMFTVGFGQEMEGVTMDEESGAFTFDKMDVSEMETDYTTMSGSIVEGDGGNLAADLTLEGGVVESIKFEMTEEDFGGEGATEMKVTVNGKEITISTADIGGDMGM